MFLFARGKKMFRIDRRNWRYVRYHISSDPTFLFLSSIDTLLSSPARPKNRPGNRLRLSVCVCGQSAFTLSISARARIRVPIFPNFFWPKRGGGCLNFDPARPMSNKKVGALDQSFFKPCRAKEWTSHQMCAWHTFGNPVAYFRFESVFMRVMREAQNRVVILRSAAGCRCWLSIHVQLMRARISKASSRKKIHPSILLSEKSLTLQRCAIRHCLSQPKVLRQMYHLLISMYSTVIGVRDSHFFPSMFCR
jgi:hypothetical protein